METAPKMIEEPVEPGVIIETVGDGEVSVGTNDSGSGIAELLDNFKGNEGLLSRLAMEGLKIRSDAQQREDE